MRCFQAHLLKQIAQACIAWVNGIGQVCRNTILPSCAYFMCPISQLSIRSIVKVLLLHFYDVLFSAKSPYRSNVFAFCRKWLHCVTNTSSIYFVSEILAVYSFSLNSQVGNQAKWGVNDEFINCAAFTSLLYIDSSTGCVVDVCFVESSEGNAIRLRLNCFLSGDGFQICNMIWVADVFNRSFPMHRERRFLIFPSPMDWHRFLNFKDCKWTMIWETFDCFLTSALL